MQLPIAERLEFVDAREIIYPGKNHDGFWTNEKLIIQVSFDLDILFETLTWVRAQVKCAIQIFNRMYPNATAEFAFDQSSAHGAFAKDALNTKEMNVKPGGKQRAMHDTLIPMDNPNLSLRGQVQTMVFPANLPPGHPDHAFRGQPKGMQRVLEERGLLSVLEMANNGKAVGECQTCKLSREAQERRVREAHAAAADGTDEVDDTAAMNAAVQELARTDCCMRKMLSSQQDFKDERSLIQIVIEEAGHKCWFLPKFHCELNLIEMYWGWGKAREFASASGNVPMA